MLILYDGIGQVGGELTKYINSIDRDVLVHHRWDHLDKSEEKQKRIFFKFQEFVTKNNGQEICFISTSTENQSPYLKYKRMAEEYLFQLPNTYTIRLPTIIGRGICNDFRESKKKPFGEMELITLEDAIKGILDVLNNNQRQRINTLKGEKISANLAYNLIMFGKHGMQS